MAGGDELGDDVRTGMAGPPCDENVHGTAPCGRRETSRYGFAQPGRLTPIEKLVCLTEWVISPSHNMQACSSVRAIVSGPVSIGRSPRLSMNAETRTFACASSPARNMSNVRPSTGPAARTWEFWVLNALTISALAGAALAISCAPKLSSGVKKPVKSGLMGLVMSTRS